MRKVIRICDSCEKEVPENYAWVDLTQVGEQGAHKTRFDVCDECKNKIKEMFHLAT